MSAASDAPRVPEPSRSPWQRLYAGAHALRRRWYRRRALRLPIPVISVGNLHWGGTGKTPFTAAICARLRDAGRRVAVLSRGYGGNGSGVRVVSTGSGPLLGPLAAGDEPVLLAAELPGVGVVVGSDRYEAGRLALERLPETPELFVLDDGFSHVRLARDVDILLFPPDDPLGGGRLPPGGRLREPLASVRHADAVIWTVDDVASGGSTAERLTDGLARYGFRGSGFCSRAVTLPAVHERHEPIPEASRVLLVTGIARPERVRRALARMPYALVDALAFGDHHPYPDESLRKIERRWRETGADYVLTTGKDHVKLVGRLEAPLARLPVRAEPQDEFWRWLDARLAGSSPEAS